MTEIKHRNPGDGYPRGCRCDPCKAEHARRARAYRANGSSRGVRARGSGSVVFSGGSPVYPVEHWRGLVGPMIPAPSGAA
jgi:hypothetical protein